MYQTNHPRTKTDADDLYVTLKMDATVISCLPVALNKYCTH